MHLFDEYKGLRKELYILFIGRMMTNLGSMIWPMLTLILSQKLMLSAGDIALYMLIYTIISFPMNILGGKLADRFNKRNMIILCDLLSVSGYIYCFFAEINNSSILIFALSSLFQNIEWPSYDALVADFTSTKDRERAYSLSYLGANLGLVLAPTLGGILFNEHLNLAFLINGLAILFSTLLIFLFIKDVHREPEEEASGYQKDIDNKISGFSYLLKSRVLLLFLFAGMFEAAVYAMYNYLMPLDMAIVHGENGPVIFGTMSSLNCIVVVACTALITRWFKKSVEVSKMLIGEVLELSGYILFIIGIRSVPVCYAAITIFTFGEIFCTLATSPFLTKRIPASHRGRIIAITNVLGSLGSALLQRFAGKVHDAAGMSAAWIFVFGLGALSLLFKGCLKVFDRKDFPKLYEVGADSEPLRKE